MITGKDIVQMRLKDKSLKIVEYTRFFFEVPAGFAQEEWKRKTNNKEINVVLTRPDQDKLKAYKPTAEELDTMNLEALSYLGQKFPDDDPQYSFLRLFSKGLDQETRTAITKDERPKKPLTESQGREAMRDVYKRLHGDKVTPEEIEIMVDAAMAVEAQLAAIRAKAAAAASDETEAEAVEVPTDE